MNRSIILFVIGCLMMFAACNEHSRKDVFRENLKAKQMLQGIWVDEDDEDVVFRVKGDTIYYPDSTSMPTYFYVSADTLVIRGANEIRYAIVKQSAHLFEFKTQNGDVLKLVKTTDKSYLSSFNHQQPVVLNQGRLVRRDTIVTFGTGRYHLYTQVNPTTYKVLKSTYNDDGVEVDNVYYDNIVNVNVYHGASRLFGRDFRKQDFRHQVPASFLEQAVLSDMVFRAVDKTGIHFRAVLAMPDSSVSYQVEVTISFDGHLNIRTAGA
mgnify:FL=1